MTTITLNREELCSLVGKEISMQELQDVLFELGLETEEIKEEEATFEINSDRPDLLSIEGIARLLRFYYAIDKKMKIPTLEKSDFVCICDESVEKVRPYIVCSIVRDITITDSTIKSLMQIQEKLHSTFGRNRKKGAIGIHDLDRISGNNITYKAIKLKSDKFVPLGEKELMTPEEILEKHEKGKDYRHILEGFEKLPVIYDEEGIFSFPPIINSARTEVTEKTKNLFIELTGEDENTIVKMLNIILYFLSERGGKIYSIKMKSQESFSFSPSFKIEEIDIEAEYVNIILGEKFDNNKIIELLAKSGFESTIDVNKIKVSIPPYRVDILHKRDIVDDIGRAYGFNNLQSTYPKTATTGEFSENTKLSTAAREVLIGSGFQDLMNFILTDKESNYKKMNMNDDGKAVELENPYSEQYTIIRTCILPSLMAVLSNNTRRKYPQNISEIGKIVVLDEKDNLGSVEIEKVAAVTCHLNAQYNEIKSKLQILAQSFDTELETLPMHHPSFIDGRCAKILRNQREVGIIGEVHPTVLKNWGIEMPVSAFEIELNILKK